MIGWLQPGQHDGGVRAKISESVPARAMTGCLPIASCQVTQARSSQEPCTTGPGRLFIEEVADVDIGSFINISVI